MPKKLLAPFMGALVLKKIATSFCAISAPRDFTRVGALTSVSAHVRLELATYCRTIPTPRDLTREGALPRVAAHVRLE